MAAPITFTFDLEDSRAGTGRPERFTAITHRLLGELAAHEVLGTFFVVGTLADAHPQLIRAISDAGHEVALHGWEHIPLDQRAPQDLADDLARGKARIEEITGAPVVGFRAPIFSLVPATRHAVDLLTEAGFTYSSSVLPARNPLYGWPGAPRAPFRWNEQLVELPCPVGRVGPAELPYLGGIYLRYLPTPLLGRLAAGTAPAVAPWTYTHPYDYDPDEPFAVMPGTSWMTSVLLHFRRRRTMDRVVRLLREHGATPPLREVADAHRTAPIVEPASVGA